MSKKFTDNQLLAIKALETFVQQLSPGAMFATVASMQLQLLNISPSKSQERVVIIKGWFNLMKIIISLLSNQEYINDLDALMEDLENELSPGRKPKTSTKEEKLFLPDNLIN